MSYIRCLSNPEGMYVFGTTCGSGSSVEIYAGHHLKPPFVSHEDVATLGIIVPGWMFYRACQRWHDGYDDVRITHKAKVLRVYEEFIFVANGVLVPDDYRGFRQDSRESRFVIRVEYDSRWVRLWDVTWEYIVRNVIDDHPKRKPARKPRSRK